MSLASFRFDGTHVAGVDYNSTAVGFWVDETRVVGLDEISNSVVEREDARTGMISIIKEKTRYRTEGWRKK